MRKEVFAVVTAVLAAGGLSAGWAQQKPVSSRTSIVVYKSPT